MALIGRSVRWRLSVVLILTFILTWIVAYQTFGLISVSLGGVILIGLLATAVFNCLLYILGFISWFASCLNINFKRNKNKKVNNTNTSRISIVVPVYNEEVVTYKKNLRIIWESLITTGITNKCTIFILSDSDNSELIEQEKQAVCDLQALFKGCYQNKVPDDCNTCYESKKYNKKIYYVQRKNRDNYKAGNVENFICAYGNDFDYLLVLDHRHPIG